MPGRRDSTLTAACWEVIESDGPILVDLRSDSVTLPTRAMVRAAVRAPIGEDAWGEDPSVNEFEAFAASLTGKEAALLCPSVRMGNLVCLLAHVGRGGQFVAHDESHLYTAELDGVSGLIGLVCQPVGGERGELDLQRLDRELAAYSTSSQAGNDGTYGLVVCVENTHLRSGGIPIGLPYLRRLRSVCDSFGVSLHIDGARAFNAAVAEGVSIAELLCESDTAALSLCKGLGAPTGAFVVGSRELVARAREARRALGGGQHKAGAVAAAGLVALRSGPGRLTDDHVRAQQLATRARSLAGAPFTVQHPRTNVVLLELQVCTRGAQWWRNALAASGVLVKAQGPRLLRCITHAGITDEAVDVVIGALADVCARAAKAVTTGPADEG